MRSNSKRRIEATAFTARVSLPWSSPELTYKARCYSCLSRQSFSAKSSPFPLQLPDVRLFNMRASLSTALMVLFFALSVRSETKSTLPPRSTPKGEEAVSTSTSNGVIGACSCTVTICEHTASVAGCHSPLYYGQDHAAFCSVDDNGSQQLFTSYSDYVYTRIHPSWLVTVTSPVLTLLAPPTLVSTLET